MFLQVNFHILLWIKNIKKGLLAIIKQQKLSKSSNPWSPSSVPLNLSLSHLLHPNSLGALNWEKVQPHHPLINITHLNNPIHPLDPDKRSQVKPRYTPLSSCLPTPTTKYKANSLAKRNLQTSFFRRLTTNSQPLLNKCPLFLQLSLTVLKIHPNGWSFNSCWTAKNS